MIFFKSDDNTISGGRAALKIYSRVNDIHGDPIFEGDTLEQQDYGGNTTYRVEFDDGKFTIISGESDFMLWLNQETVESHNLVKT